MAKQWVRYVMPVMVEVDVEDDKVTQVITLPAEIREDRDDMGHFLIYDEKFVRRDSDEQPQLHAFCVGEPRWTHELRVGGPANWPGTHEWEEDFTGEDGDAYAEINPYDLRER